MTEPIYKIMPAADWEAAQAGGVYRGSADDARDGFIHFSTRDQVAGTLAKHFTGQTNLVLVEIDPVMLGSPLRWELSRGGQLFPHLYDDLPVTAATSVASVAAD